MGMNTDQRPLLARNLDYLISKAGTSPYALEKLTGVNQPTIHRILTGESASPRDKNIQPLADYFRVTVSELRYKDLQEIDVLGEPDEADFAMISQLDVRASCGPGGKFHDHIVVKGGLAFKRTFLGEMQVNEKHSRIIHAEGPSMEPTIGHGRVVLINMADTAPQDGRVFLICDEDGGMILKRLVREYEPSIGATIWKIRSDNPDKRKYPDKFWPEDSRACIIGRAIWHDGLL